MSKTEKPTSAPASSKKPDAARRALLRGVAIGIPSVVTLASGSAWGAAGSIPCFTATYQGKFGPVGNKYRWNGDYTFNNGATVVRNNQEVTQSNTSMFCWNSGGPFPWNQLP